MSTGVLESVCDLAKSLAYQCSTVRMALGIPLLIRISIVLCFEIKNSYFICQSNDRIILLFGHIFYSIKCIFELKTKHKSIVCH